VTGPAVPGGEPDPQDVQLARSATGLLRTYNAAGVLAAADVHVALCLARLAGEPDERVQLAAALAVRGVRFGSVCVDLPRAHRTVVVDRDEPAAVAPLPWPDPAGWLAACGASPLVAGRDDPAGAHPLRLVGDLLYLDRYWRDEGTVAGQLSARAGRAGPAVDLDRLRAGVARLFPGPGPDRQRLAAVVAALGRLTVLVGGPGTGKTTTVARLLALLHDQPGDPPRVALAAPTGKAAARLEEAVRAGAGQLPPLDRQRLGELTGVTLHRLLGVRPDSRSRFRHDRHNHLPYDVVVVDETSMVSLTLMARLVEAVRPEARLVLVGDPDQLASVEAGAVLADLVDPAAGDPGAADVRRLVPADLEPAGAGTPAGPLPGTVVALRRAWRFGGGIARLAAAVQAGDAGTALAALRDGGGDVSFTEFAEPDPARPLPAEVVQPLRHDVVAAAEALAEAARAGDAQLALDRLSVHRLLCAHRRGPYGVGHWTGQVERWLAGVVPAELAGEWYPGRPLLVTSNDYEVGLYNGDAGVVVADRDGTAWAAFARGGLPVLIRPSRLSAVQTVHAMTVHRSQGSGFDRVSVLLPPAGSPLLTRQLLYTAVTRARVHVRVLGTEAAVRAAVDHPVSRASGLRERLRQHPRSGDTPTPGLS
jgi:exodeoxyribonuclease V alpha subunit